MSKMTSAASVALFLFADGWLVQFELRCPLLPHRKQIGDEFPLEAPFPSGRFGLPHCGKLIAAIFGFARAFGRGPLLPVPLDFHFPRHVVPLRP